MLLLSGWRLSIGTPWNDQKTFIALLKKQNPVRIHRFCRGFFRGLIPFRFCLTQMGFQSSLHVALAAWRWETVVTWAQGSGVNHAEKSPDSPTRFSTW